MYVRYKAICFPVLVYPSNFTDGETDAPVGRTICPYLAHYVNLDYKKHALSLIMSFILLASCFSANKLDKRLLPQSFLNK